MQDKCDPSICMFPHLIYEKEDNSTLIFYEWLSAVFYNNRNMDLIGSRY